MELGGIVSNVEPMVFPSRNIGGGFVGQVSVPGLLPKLDVGAPYNGWFFWRWVVALPGKESEKDPNGVQFQ
jgi:hypothetical protein